MNKQITFWLLELDNGEGSSVKHKLFSLIKISNAENKKTHKLFCLKLKVILNSVQMENCPAFRSATTKTGVSQWGVRGSNSHTHDKHSKCMHKYCG